MVPTSSPKFHIFPPPLGIIVHKRGFNEVSRDVVACVWGVHVSSMLYLEYVHTQTVSLFCEDCFVEENPSSAVVCLGPC